MTRAEIQDRIHRLAFQDKAEQDTFLHELDILSKNKQTAPLIRNNTITPLKDMFLSHQANMSNLELLFKSSLGQSQEAFLLPYFETLLEKGLSFPEKGSAIECFIHICSRFPQSDLIPLLLECGILNYYQTHYLQQLRYFHQDNLHTFTHFYSQHKDAYNDKEKILIIELLHLLYPTTLNEGSVADIHQYMKEILPVFIQRFSHRMDADMLFNSVDRVAEWYMVWMHYHQKSEAHLEETDEYYQMEFPTVIKYVPEFIWWNNGLYYNNGDKNFYFGSPGFSHLAKGGSIRHAPDQHHFTRRMAKIFVNLPYNYDQTDRDMYIECYGKAMGAGPLLLDMMQQFVRHPNQMTDLQTELDKWNPVIQKLACEDFEAIDREQAIPFMGYLYHCLRDKPGFTVQRRSIATLLRESDAYNQRIQERTEARTRERRERRRRLDAEEKRRRGIWEKHRSIKDYEDSPYAIVELTNRNELQQEGAVLNHCVGSYTNKCIAGGCSIWSLREKRNKDWFRLVTIELSPKKRVIQASGRFNATPSKDHLVIIRRWAKDNNVTI